MPIQRHLSFKTGILTHRLVHLADLASILSVPQPRGSGDLHDARCDVELLHRVLDKALEDFTENGGMDMVERLQSLIQEHPRIVPVSFEGGMQSARRPRPRPARRRRRTTRELQKMPWQSRGGASREGKSSMGTEVWSEEGSSEEYPGEVDVDERQLRGWEEEESTEEELEYSEDGEIMEKESSGGSNTEETLMTESEMSE